MTLALGGILIVAGLVAVYKMATSSSGRLSIGPLGIGWGG